MICNMVKKSNKSIFEITEKMVVYLNDNGVGCYIWHVATTGSCYIRFEDVRLGSIRLSDHQGRSNLKYKFNLRTDVKASEKPIWKKEEGKWRMFMNLYYYRHAAKVIIQNAERLKTQTWGAKREYFIPTFKRINSCQ